MKIISKVMKIEKEKFTALSEKDQNLQLLRVCMHAFQFSYESTIKYCPKPYSLTSHINNDVRKSFVRCLWHSNTYLVHCKAEDHYCSKIVGSSTDKILYFPEFPTTIFLLLQNTKQ